MLSRSQGLIALSAIGVVLAAAGCGGSSKPSQADTQYASSVCSAIGSWEHQIRSIASSSGGGLSKASLEAKFSQAQTATKSLVTQLKSIPPPNTSQGKTVKQQLSHLSSQISSTVSAVKSQLAKLKGNASAATIAAAVTALVPQVKNLATTTKSTLTSLQQAKGSLAKAFKSSSACKSLQK